MAQNPASIRTPSFSDIQFKATHNSYRLPDRPSDQIVDYNVWEIELDFGVMPASQEFIVGHDGPEPHNDLRSLEDWILDIKRAVSSIAHPIIVKLEAKTKDRSGPFTDREWLPVNQWGEWQERLTNNLIAWLGKENWMTRREFESEYSSIWPPIDTLSGKYIITLQDNNNNRDIDTTSPWFFPENIPGLTAAWPHGHPIHNASQFAASIMDGANRLIMDDGYLQAWSNIFVHPPAPCYVCPSASGPQWGTMEHPFHSLGQAINAHWTFSGMAFPGQAIFLGASCSAPENGNGPISVYPGMGGTPTRSGKTAYMIALRLQDVDQASTNDPIRYRIEGENGVTGDIPFGYPGMDLVAGGMGMSWCEWDDLGRLDSIIIGVAGDDDIAVDWVIVISSISGRYISDVNGWIGNDHENPAHIELISRNK